MKSVLDQTLEKNKQKYIDRLLKLVSIDTHDIGHGIEGGLEAEGQEYLAEIFSGYWSGRDCTRSPQRRKYNKMQRIIPGGKFRA